MRRLVRIAAVPFLVAACAPTREPAPEDLDGLLHYLYRYHDDEVAVADAMGIFGEWLDDEGRDEDAREGFRLTPLTEEDVAPVDHPGRDLTAAGGVGVGTVSPFPDLDHAGATVLFDQRYNDPDSYARYERDIVEGEASAFEAGEGTIRTVNDIDKTKVGVSIPYILYKDFEWVRIDADRRAFVGRSWVTEPSCSENGNNCLHQSFSVDVWYARDDEDTVRFTATWNEVTSVADAFLSEDQIVAVAVNGMLSIFDSTDAFLAGEP